MHQLQLYAEKYENLYIQPKYSLFHTISCITSQEVNFNTGRSIRKQLYGKCGEHNLSPDILTPKSENKKT